MGMKLFGRSAGDRKPPNPDPSLFTIIRKQQVGPLAILMVHYPGCTTFGGNKVSVYRAPLSMLELLVELDPHFTDDSLSPIARFRGDESGWRLAVNFAEHSWTLKDTKGI